MLITVMSEARAPRAPPRPARGIARLPPGGGDEPVRRRSAPPASPARSTTGCAGSRSTTNPRREEQDDHRRAAVPTASTPSVGRQGGRARAPHPHPSGPARRIVGARRDRHVRRSRRRSPRCADLAGRRAERVARRGARRPVGPRPAPRGQRPHRRGRRHASCGRPCSAERVPRDGDGEGKLAPRLGPRLPLKSPPTPRRATRPTKPWSRRASGPRSRRELARNPRFEQISPEVGELDEAAVDDALADDPDDDAGDAGRSHRRDRPEAPRVGETDRRAACSSTSPAAARRSHGGRVAGASCRTGPIGATSISTPAST